MLISAAPQLMSAMFGWWGGVGVGGGGEQPCVLDADPERTSRKLFKPLRKPQWWSGEQLVSVWGGSSHPGRFQRAQQDSSNRPHLRKFFCRLLCSSLALCFCHNSVREISFCWLLSNTILSQCVCVCVRERKSQTGREREIN